MPSTLPYIEISEQWVNLNSFTAIPVGVTMTIQNTGSHVVVLRMQDTPPASDDVGELLYPYRKIKTGTSSPIVWCRAYTKEKRSRVQVDISGGFIDPAAVAGLGSDSLQIQIAAVNVSPESEVWLLVHNSTTATLSINEIVTLEGYSTGVQSGTSIISSALTFNPDVTGATLLPSESKAYINNVAGDFADITGIGIFFNVIPDLNTGLNPDRVLVAGGAVSFFASGQAVSSSSLSSHKAFSNPYFVPPGGRFLASFHNVALVDGGTDVVLTMLFTARFLTLTGRLVQASDNLIDDAGDNLVDNLGNNLTE